MSALIDCVEVRSEYDCQNGEGISIRDIDYSYGVGKARKQVLFSCSLDLHPGEIVILTGPSGSGKTTLLTLIGALRSIQKGAINFMGHELQHMSMTKLNIIRRRIGFMFQDHNLFEALSAVQTLRLAMALDTANNKANPDYDVNAGISSMHKKQHEEIVTHISMDGFTGAAKYIINCVKEAFDRSYNKTKCIEILNRLGLGGLENSLPSELSTGQKQRVAIARALINNPDVILADEPTASLDKESGLIVMELIRERAKADRAIVLIVSHDHRLFPFADRIIHMEDGEIIESPM